MRGKWRGVKWTPNDTMITSDNLIETLRQYLPAFQIHSDWIEGNLGYPIINDLGRYLCELATCKDYAGIKTGIDFLKLCVEEGDSYVRDLVHECLETLDSCEEIDDVMKKFGMEINLLRQKAR